MAENEQQTQEIVVTVLKGDSVVETFCFPDAPMQAAEIEHALEKAGHKGLLQNAKYTYTSKHLLQHGAYTLKVSEAAAGSSKRIADLEISFAQLRESVQPKKRHRTAYTSVLVADTNESRLWESEVMGPKVMRRFVEIDEVLAAERPLLADLRYVRLLAMAWQEDASDILDMKQRRTRGQADLEPLYHPLLLTMLQASASGQPDIDFAKEAFITGDRSRADMRCLVQGREAEAVEVKPKEVPAGALDEEAIDKNRAAFGKLYKIIRAHYLPVSQRRKFLGIFANRIDAVYFAQMCFDEPGKLMTECRVAPRIPQEGALPAGILCRELDSVEDNFKLEMAPKLADFLLLGGMDPAPGWRLLVRYVDTLCQLHHICPVTYGLQYADSRELLDISAGRVVARGAKSMMLEVPGCNNTFKVGPFERIEQDYQIHMAVDEVEGIRRVVRGGWGRVAGVDKLGFLELEGKATPIDALTHPAEVATACRVLQRALQGMHARGVLHRDISKGNILRVGSQFKLNDFDISTLSQSTPHELLRRCGTPAFTSPWWADASPYCEAYDRHALGLTMATVLQLPGSGEGLLTQLWQCDIVPAAFKEYCVPPELQR